MIEEQETTGIAIEILVIILLVAINGVLAMSEIALVKSRKIRLKELLKKGKRGAMYALHLVRNPNRFLSTIQIGISLMGILSGVYGGAVIASQLEHLIKDIPYISDYSSTVSYVLVVATITYLLLVLGELIPKRIAMLNPEKISSVIAIPMVYLSKLAAPAVFILSISTNGLLRIFRIKRHEEEPPSEDEIKHMFRQGARSGTFEPDEVNMVERVLKLDDQTVGSLMTRLEDMVKLMDGESFDDIMNKVRVTGHTCYPVLKKGDEEILGTIHAKDLLSAGCGDRPSIKDFVKPAVYVQRGMNVLDMMDQFKKSREHMILVNDKDGHVVGLVTINDVLQAITGQLPSPKWPQEPWIIHRKDGSMLLDGRLGLDELKEVLDMSENAQEDSFNVREDYDTLAGLVMSMMSKVPISGDKFELGGYSFEVVDMDGLQVDKVLVKVLPDVEDSGQDRDVE